MRYEPWGKDAKDSSDIEKPNASAEKKYISVLSMIQMTLCVRLLEKSALTSRNLNLGQAAIQLVFKKLWIVSKAVL